MPQDNEKINTAQTVIVEVANALQTSGSDVKGKLVSLLVDREITRRVGILDKALVKHKQLISETKKVANVPMTKTFTIVDGSPVESLTPTPMTEAEMKAFTKANKEAKEKLEKFEKTLDSAFNSPTNEVFDKLDKLCAGKSDDKDSE